MYELRSGQATAPSWNPSKSLIERSRWAILALIAFVLLALGYAHAWDGSARLTTTPETTYEIISVADGETLWGIATDRYPNADPRLKIAQIEQLNGLRGPAIEAGQRLKVPVG